jgi:hypothetical protein
MVSAIPGLVSSEVVEASAAIEPTEVSFSISRRFIELTVKVYPRLGKTWGLWEIENAAVCWVRRFFGFARALPFKLNQTVGIALRVRVVLMAAVSVR